MEGDRNDGNEMAKLVLSRKKDKADVLKENQDEWHKYFDARDSKGKIPQSRCAMTENEPSSSNDKTAYADAENMPSDKNSPRQRYCGCIESFSDDEMDPEMELVFNRYFANVDRKRKRPQKKTLD